MILLISILFCGISIVGFYTIHLQKQIDKTSKEINIFKQKVIDKFKHTHDDTDTIDKTMKNKPNSKQQLNG